MNDSLPSRTVYTSPDYRLKIVNDTIALANDGRWADATVYRETSGKAIDFFGNVIIGTYDVAGGIATFHASNGDGFSGTIANGTLTITIGARAVYRK